ncbi:MAG: CoB--CoM heterodisulfide reductase iron-sulfur subunit B family protein [Desulfitobacteriia bacterium]|jgi:heterodisulfide reductase subunit B
MALKIGYYPGCSLHGMSKSFDTSAQLVCRKLGIELRELPDWNCCGATSGHSVEPTLTLTLGARNLNLVTKSGLRAVTAPCAACYSNLIKASHDLKEPQKRELAQELLGEKIEDVEVIHLMDVISEPSILENLKSNITKKFKNLKVACYYGCLTVRPRAETQAVDSENPQTMDNLLRLLGIETKDWSHKTECCGGSFSICGPELANLRTDEVLNQAKASGAEAIVVACPLCHTNLEMRLHALNSNIPVVYFTQLLGLALGYSVKEVQLHKLLVNSFPWKERLTS